MANPAALTLKQPTAGSIPTFPGTSSILLKTGVSQDEASPRDYYLANLEECSPPVISSSSFVPHALIAHLMRNKKNLAVGVKFVSKRNDAITNMEGAMHTYITPVLSMSIHGDYRWSSGHGTRRFRPQAGKQRARTVILSASIQPDFETTEVMLGLCSLQSEPVVGDELPSQWSIPSVAAKQIKAARVEYDLALKRHMIYHLTRASCLPSLSSVKPVTMKEAIDALQRHITQVEDQASFEGLYVQLGNLSRSVISIEVLYMTAVQQLRNELSALECVAAEQGYVYTYDPASIFAAELGGDATLLNRLMLAALQHIANSEALHHMKVFAFNDYNDVNALSYAREALRSVDVVKVVAKSELFNFNTKKGALGYRPLPETDGALLVLHNNSDAFGQNIEYEVDGGSMDGALGVASSAAASLHRGRKDLLDHLM